MGGRLTWDTAVLAILLDAGVALMIAAAFGG